MYALKVLRFSNDILFIFTLDFDFIACVIIDFKVTHIHQIFKLLYTILLYCMLLLYKC